MNPYQDLPSNAFWRPAIAERSMFDVDELWNPKFDITKKTKFSTYGSCFAQHIGKALARNGYDWLATEQALTVTSDELKKKYNYGVFTSRTGNIYTTSLLKQWVDWCSHTLPAPTEIWQDGDRFYDPFRPAVEPNGFASEEELHASRQHTISCFKRSIKRADCFVFTLGLTESWCNKNTGLEYPMCPGAVAGIYDETIHGFKNLTFQDVYDNLRAAIEKMLQLNPKLKFLLTVSPVPLTATYSEKHVLVATVHSKSILRAVAGTLANEMDQVDYFPSYEIITSPTFKGVFFGPNQRSVMQAGVDFVMSQFFRSIGDAQDEHNRKPDRRNSSARARRANRQKRITKGSDEVCEEELLDAFGGGHS